ncbi:MAG: cell division protein FtsZ, partial [Halolamina sp.]
GGPDLTLKEAEGIADNITERLDASANVIWGARIQDSYNGKVRVMAIMTGVQSAQVLGPSTQKQADESRAALNDDVAASEFDAKANAEATSGAGGSERAWQSDGGREEPEQNNGLDVIR